MLGLVETLKLSKESVTTPAPVGLTAGPIQKPAMQVPTQAALSQSTFLVAARDGLSELHLCGPQGTSQQRALVFRCVGTSAASDVFCGEGTLHCGFASIDLCACRGRT